MCFAGRLDKDVTDDDLTAFLKDKGIANVRCTKLIPKDGRIRVSCSIMYQEIFYRESLWPEGVELRDWVFRSDGLRQ